MKKTLTALLTIASFTAMAQQNTLLTTTFWQDAPSVEVVKAEIAKGNSPTQGTAFSDPILMAINAQAPTATIKFLLDQPGVDPNKSLHDARTYLQWAATRGNDEVMEYLISKGAKIDVEDSHGTTALTFAASSGQQNTKVYDVLIAHGVNLKKDVNGDGANVLLLAIANDKDFKLTDYFVSKGLSLKSTDAAGNNAFSYAAKTGNIELLKTLVQKGIPVNQNAMLMAAQGGGGRRGPGGASAASAGSGMAIYQYLESVGVKPTATAKNGENALHYIVRKPGQAEIIQYFLAKGLDVNQADEDGNTVFMDAAATNRDTTVLALLLPKIKNINQANTQGATALTLAVRGNSAATMGYLISKGADAKALDKKGNNLAFYLIDAYRPQQQERGGQGGSRPGGQQGERGAVSDEFEAKITALKNAGLNLAAPQQNGNTLYHLAVAKNDLTLFKRLQPLGIDVNAKNQDGMTALHKAALIAKDDVLLQYLVSIGAKKEVGTDFNETAYDLASANQTLNKNKVSINFLK
jgi:ankyrin repeat protein